MEEDREGSSINVDSNDEQLTDDNFTLSNGATLTQDELETGKSQMDAVDIEWEINNLLTIDDSIQYPPFAADPSMNQEPAATSPIPDPRSSQNDHE